MFMTMTRMTNRTVKGAGGLIPCRSAPAVR